MYNTLTNARYRRDTMNIIAMTIVAITLTLGTLIGWTAYTTYTSNAPQEPATPQLTTEVNRNFTQPTPATEIEMPEYNVTIPQPVQ